MNLLVLGRGKTGSLVAEVARERKHTVLAFGSMENSNARRLTPANRTDIVVVVDFTTPQAVVQNIAACTACSSPTRTRKFSRAINHIRHLNVCHPERGRMPESKDPFVSQEFTQPICNLQSEIFNSCIFSAPSAFIFFKP